MYTFIAILIDVQKDHLQEAANWITRWNLGSKQELIRQLKKKVQKHSSQNFAVDSLSSKCGSYIIEKDEVYIIFLCNSFQTTYPRKVGEKNAVSSVMGCDEKSYLRNRACLLCFMEKWSKMYQTTLQGQK